MSTAAAGTICRGWFLNTDRPSEIADSSVTMGYGGLSRDASNSPYLSFLSIRLKYSHRMKNEDALLFKNIHPSTQLSNFQGKFRNFGFTLKNFRTLTDVMLKEMRLMRICNSGVEQVVWSLWPEQKNVHRSREKRICWFLTEKNRFFSVHGNPSEQGRRWQNVKVIHNSLIRPENFVTCGVSFGEPKLGPLKLVSFVFTVECWWGLVRIGKFN